MLIPKNTSVLIRRVPGRPRMTIVTEQEYYLKPLISLTAWLHLIQFSYFME